MIKLLKMLMRDRRGNALVIAGASLPLEAVRGSEQHDSDDHARHDQQDPYHHADLFTANELPVFQRADGQLDALEARLLRELIAAERAWKARTGGPK